MNKMTQNIKNKRKEMNISKCLTLKILVIVKIRRI
jgi:hypothetical protein